MALEKWQWSWLAGIFEGEGTTSFTNERSAQVRIIMTDEDVIRTVDSLVPSPRGIKRYDYPNKKTQWKWQLSGRDDVRGFLTAIQPYLHSRRSKRVDEALERMATNLGDHAKRTHCKRGHPFAGDNLQIAANGTRHCKACQKERDRTRVRKR